MRAAHQLNEPLPFKASVKPTSRFNPSADLVDESIAGYRIISTLDLSTCRRCAALDGRVFPSRVGPRPPFHPKCRCAAVPVAKSWKELGIDLPEFPPGTRASMFGQVPADWRYFDWLARREEHQIERVLGPELARLFRLGGLTPSEFADALLDPTYALKPLSELRLAIPEAFPRAGTE